MSNQVHTESVIDILKRVGAIIPDSHFVGTSGRHMSTYINKDALYPNPVEASKVGKLFAEKFIDRPIDIVVAPTMGAIILAHWTAFHLTQMTSKNVQSVYTEKTADNDQIFKRGYDALVKGKQVLVLEDLTTTGGSVKKVVKTVQKAGGQVIEVCVMVNRDEERVTAEFMEVPFSSLGVYPVESYAEEECPLCKAEVPVNTIVGHGKEFLAKQKLKGVS